MSSDDLLLENDSLCSLSLPSKLEVESAGEDPNVESAIRLDNETM